MERVQYHWGHRDPLLNLAMSALIENIMIMLLTIVVLVGGGFLLLVLLNWGLKLKSGNREEQGLIELWAQAQKEQKASDPKDPPADDKPT